MPKKSGPAQVGGVVLIDAINPQPEIRRNAETANYWEHREEAAFLHRWAVTFEE